jgi:hypothetical protein
MITRSVINNVPFDPVFPVENKNLRITAVQLQQGQIKVSINPVGPVRASR